MKRAATGSRGGTQGSRVPQTSACSRFTSDMKSQTAQTWSDMKARSRGRLSTAP